VEVILEECGHKIEKKCHEKEPNCTFKCYDRLDCGHACVLNCHKNNDPEHETVIFLMNNFLFKISKYNHNFSVF
jgi:hypothetical protein